MSHLSDEDDEFLYGTSDALDTKTKGPLDTKTSKLRSRMTTRLLMLIPSCTFFFAGDDVDDLYDIYDDENDTKE